MPDLETGRTQQIVTDPVSLAAWADRNIKPTSEFAMAFEAKNDDAILRIVDELAWPWPAPSATLYRQELSEWAAENLVEGSAFDVAVRQGNVVIGQMILSRTCIEPKGSKMHRGKRALVWVSYFLCVIIFSTPPSALAVAYEGFNRADPWTWVRSAATVLLGLGGLRMMCKARGRMGVWSGHPHLGLSFGGIWGDVVCETFYQA